MVEDTDERSKNSDDLVNINERISNLESTGSDNVEGDNNSVHQDYRTTLQSRGKSKWYNTIWQEKNL